MINNPKTSNLYFDGIGLPFSESTCPHGHVDYCDEGCGAIIGDE